MKIGHWILFYIISLSVLFFVLAKYSIDSHPIDIYRYTSQLLAILGTSLFSISFILSAKFHSVEKAFGGMDKVFKIHTKLSIIAFLCLLHHPLLLIVSVLPNTDAAIHYIIPSERIEISSGILALYILIVLVVVTLFVDLPYHIWKNTHTYLYMVLFVASIHVFFIPSDTFRFFPLRIWLFVLLGSAFFVFFWNRIVLALFQKKLRYTITSIKQHDDILYFSLSPTRRNIQFRPGQFAYLSHKGKRISNEEHPFSIASSPLESELRFGIRMVGDYTTTLSKLTLGDAIEVSGPYGVFGEQFLSSSSESLCIAAGIGITPFVSLLSYARSMLPDKKIHLIYCVKHDDVVPFHDELFSLQNDNIRISLHVSSKMGRLTLQKIQSIMPFHSRIQVLLCGPHQMMQSISKQCVGVGISQKRIVFEDFSFL